ncbi:hypothetical protein SSABA_v1c04820 [Spiroplasma sabaudiense Ar-1343]|uniref:Transmembrane protein n=1 Tax=Spiroplasma sabaudiense Ar-1343 TaxID=1276257 RepID=W6AJJ2_9MOLU|nr:hypothetical protein [Spiroplasma sabaudiense]AHI53889.1 hypothetical protein SSABA_v1c04820 [Spiroplasma sabaudiense Ar-1343]
MQKKYIWAFENKNAKSIFILALVQGIFLSILASLFFFSFDLINFIKINEMNYEIFKLIFDLLLAPLIIAAALFVFIGLLYKINQKDKSREDMDHDLESKLAKNITFTSSILIVIALLSLISIFQVINWNQQIAYYSEIFKFAWIPALLQEVDINNMIKLVVSYLLLTPVFIISITLFVKTVILVNFVAKDPVSIFKSDYILPTKKLMTTEELKAKSSKAKKVSRNQNSNDKDQLKDIGPISDFKNFNERMAAEKNHWDELTKVDGININLTKEISDLEDFDIELKKKCEKFLQMVIKIYEKGKNVNNDMYKKFKITYSALIDNSLDYKLGEVKASISDYIDFTNEADVKFVNKIEDLINADSGILNDYKDIFKTLISKYRSGIKHWDLFEAEVAIEQIFAMALNFSNLIPKVGFCIKHRLVNNFDSIEKEYQIITKMDFARDNKKYDSYKLICEDAIIKMSPIKNKITKFIEEL